MLNEYINAQIINNEFFSKIKKNSHKMRCLMFVQEILNIKNLTFKKIILNTSYNNLRCIIGNENINENKINNIISYINNYD